MSNKLQAAVEIAEEIEVAIFPLLTATQNEAEPDTYLICRGIHRQMKVLAEILREVSRGNQESNNNKYLCTELEVSACKLEGLRTYIYLLMETASDNYNADLLDIALDRAFEVGKGIARVRGLEYP